MKKLFVGAFLVIFSLPAVSANFFKLLNIAAGIIPVLLILGGALACYLGYEDIRAQKDAPPEDQDPEDQVPENQDADNQNPGDKDGDSPAPKEAPQAPTCEQASEPAPDLMPAKPLAVEPPATQAPAPETVSEPQETTPASAPAQEEEKAKSEQAQVIEAKAPENPAPAAAAEPPVQADDAPEIKADDPPEDASPAFVGNADTLVFHSMTCKFSKGKKCTVAFETRDQAIAQGYTPCKVCKP